MLKVGCVALGGVDRVDISYSDELRCAVDCD